MATTIQLSKQLAYLQMQARAYPLTPSFVLETKNGDLSKEIPHFVDDKAAAVKVIATDLDPGFNDLEHTQMGLWNLWMYHLQ